MPRSDSSGEEYAAFATHPFAAEGMNLREIGGVLRRRFLVVLLIATGVLGGTGLWLWYQPTQFTAIARVLLVDARQTISGGVQLEATEAPVGRFTDPVLSQLELLRGRTVLGQVVDREGLRLAPASKDFRWTLLGDVSVGPGASADSIHLRFGRGGYAAIWASGESEARYGAPTQVDGVRFSVPAAPGLDHATLLVLPREVAIDSIERRLTTRRHDGTDIIQVNYESPDSAKAVRVVNAVVREFHAFNLDHARRQSHRRRVFLEEQLRATDSILVEAQQALSAFRGRSRLYDAGQQLAAHHQSLIDLDIRLEELEADRSMFERLLSELEQRGEGEAREGIRTLAAVPSLQSTSVVAQLYDRLATYDAERDVLTAGTLGHTSDHPDVERLDRLIVSTEAQLVDAVRRHVVSIEARLAAVGTLRSQTFGLLQQLPGAGAEEARLAQHVESASRLADDLRTDLQRARMAEAMEAGQVEIIELAERALPNGGERTLLVLAMMVGLLLGCGGAFVAEVLDTTVRRRSQLDPLIDLSRVTVVPRLEAPARRKRRRQPRFVPAPGTGPGKGRALVKPGGRSPPHDDQPGREAYLKLRNALIRWSPSAKVVLVTSALPEEGKTTTVVNLAASFARLDRRVILLDCDCYRPQIHRVFGLSSAPGVLDVIERRKSLEEAIRKTEHPKLCVLPGGTETGDPHGEFLQGRAMDQLLSELRAGFDLVFIDAPPILPASAAAALAAKSDAVLFVLRAGQTQRTAAERALDELASVDAHVVAAVLNDPEARLVDDPYSRYSYAYS